MRAVGLCAGAPVFAPLPTVTGGWPCIAIDAPLHFSTWSAKGQGRAPSRHYVTHAIEIIMALPVRDVAARHAWLWLWWPDPHVVAMPDAMTSLGFKFSAKGFTWIKTRRALADRPTLVSTDDIGSALAFGGGLTTRKNSESCWLGRRGNPKILAYDVHEVIVAPVREHSRKPDEFYRRVEAFCPGPRLDLFGRESRSEWRVWGDQATLFDGVAR
jgi:N6-adenosine-specific RNA methylase IME4